MMHRLFPDSAVWQRLQVGPLGNHLDGFAQRLLQAGYADSTVRDKVRLVAKLSQWLERHRLGVETLDEQQITTFRHELHQREHRACHGDGDTLRGLSEYLRGKGVVQQCAAAPDSSALMQIEHRFAHYLAQERGLSADALRNYLPVIRRFLTTRFGDGPVQSAQLQARDITRFVLSQTRRLGPKTAQLMVSALRSFLRFLLQRGELATDLAGAVPSVADWRLAKVPKYLEPAQVEQLLIACDQNSVVGQRDYTVLLMLARLGLRAGEIVHLRLDDVNWPAGVITLRGKGPCVIRLPLPVDIGEALATYLRCARPPCATRRLFVRARAPHVGFASSVAIDCIVRRALHRAGLKPVVKGAHLLRHSLATRMLRSGASLAEIGQLLGHRLPQTTEIYAKVDQGALAELAQPWPGGEA